MGIDDLKLKMTLVQIELAELRQIVSAKEETLKALEWMVNEINSDETTHGEYIAQVEKEEALEIAAAAAAQECLLDPIVDIESEENEKESITSEETADVKIQSFNIEPLSVDALSIMAIKYYKKTGEAVTDIIEERFNVKSLHKLNDFQNCTLQLILMGETWNQ